MKKRMKKIRQRHKRFQRLKDLKLEELNNDMYHSIFENFPEEESSFNRGSPDVASVGNRRVRVKKQRKRSFRKKEKQADTGRERRIKKYTKLISKGKPTPMREDLKKAAETNNQIK